MNNEAGFEQLGKSIIDNIKEEQAKLGYRKETIYLYYPLSSLKHFFGQTKTEEEMRHTLSHFPASIRSRLGNIKVSNQKERFCFEIPETGSEYVHNHVKDNEFIRELIHTVSEHGCTIEKIISLFQSYSSNIEVVKMNNKEFDYRISFLEDKEDQYYYCFHDEGCHMIYHRFTQEDYKDFDL